MSVLFQFVFMFVQLTRQFVDQGVNCGIHVLVFRGGMQLASIHVHRRFRNLLHFFHAKHDIHLIYAVKILFEFGELGVHELAQWFGDFDVVSGNVELHSVFLLY